MNENMANYQYTIDLPMPSPDLLPEDVIGLILESLQQNDAEDIGIETTFNFASPLNKQAAGPLENYKQQVKDPLFQPILNFTSYQTSQLVSDGERAQQIVITRDEEGTGSGFLFTLSKQAEVPYQDCWMTDSVRRVNPKVYGITV
jgi:hypothetical protein